MSQPTPFANAIGVAADVGEQPTPNSTPAATKRLMFSSPASENVANAAAAPTASAAALSVFVRIKPLDEEEDNHDDNNKNNNNHHNNGSNNTILVRDSTTILARAPPASYAAKRGEVEASYRFDAIFDHSASQEEIFEVVARPLAEQVLRGRSALLFAYGCTNAGKTHTITGPPSSPGIVPRCFDLFFDSIQSAGRQLPSLSVEAAAMSDDFRYAVWLSYLEIYNERVYDLLSTNDGDGDREQLKLKEDKAGKVFVKGLREQLVKSAADARAALALGLHRRATHSTLANADSSRSHSILTLKLVAVPRGISKDELRRQPQLLRVSKLSIVDLAGSERARRAATSGARLKEAATINNSLVTFHRCIDTMRYNQKAVARRRPTRVVPYRDSLLTRLFQDYFLQDMNNDNVDGDFNKDGGGGGGNGGGEGDGDGGSASLLPSIPLARMIVNVNPATEDFDETSQVLKLSAVAQEVKVQSMTDTGRGKRGGGGGGASASKQRGGGATSSGAPSLPTFDPAYQTVLDNEILNELVNECDFLRQQLGEAELYCVQVEAEVRAEVSDEMSTRLARMEATYKQRVHEEVSMVERKYERKLNILERVKSARVAGGGGGDAATFEILRDENHRLEQQLSQISSVYEALKSEEATKRAKLEVEVAKAMAAAEAATTRADVAASRADDAAATARMEKEANLQLIAQLQMKLEEAQRKMEEMKKKMATAATAATATATATATTSDTPSSASRRGLRSRAPSHRHLRALTAAVTNDDVSLPSTSISTSVTGQGVSVVFSDEQLAAAATAMANDDDADAAADADYLSTDYMNDDMNNYDDDYNNYNNNNNNEEDEEEDGDKDVGVAVTTAQRLASPASVWTSLELDDAPPPPPPATTVGAGLRAKLAKVGANRPPVFSRTYSKRRQLRIGHWTAGGWGALPSTPAPAAAASKKRQSSTDLTPIDGKGDGSAAKRNKASASYMKPTTSSASKQRTSPARRTRGKK